MSLYFIDSKKQELSRVRACGLHLSLSSISSLARFFHLFLLRGEDNCG